MSINIFQLLNWPVKPVEKEGLNDETRVADVGGARERRSTTGQGLQRQEGPPTYAILLRNSVLSRFTRFLKGFCRALNESHPAFVEHSTKAILLS